METTPAAVASAYRGLLGRDPESDEVVAAQISQHPQYESLLASIAASGEFGVRAGMPSAAALSMATTAEVQCSASEDELARLLDRTAKQWTQLGTEVPYWSVLSDEKYLPEQFAENESEFWESGRWILEALDGLESQAGVTISGGTCVELGAGVGRMTRSLATRFSRTIALDVSATNLELCRAATQGLAVEPVLLTDIRELVDIPKMDCLVSFIALQHNPPPVQAEILRVLLSKLNPSGVALCQIATGAPGYTFDVRSYLASEPGEMDMHAFPIDAMLRIVRESNMDIITLRSDEWIGAPWASHTIGAIKRP